MADDKNNDQTLLEAVLALASDLAAHRQAVTERLDAVETKADNAIIASKRKMDADPDDVAAERTAADSVTRADLRVLQEQVNRLVTTQPRALTQADRDAFADAQAAADAVLRTHGETADQPMRGEELAAYLIRLHRPMLKHSKKWGKAELARIAADSAVFNNVLAEIRSDAYQAGLNPVGLPEFQHREIKTESPGGHRITTFVGNGTIFKQLSRPVRQVAGFVNVPQLGRPGVSNSGAGAIRETQ